MPPSTMSEFSREAARHYLQTAVFVDDHIYEAGPGKVIPTANLHSPAPPRKPALASVATTATALPPTVGSVVDDAKDNFSAQKIVVSFANEGVVCALYQPPGDSNLDETSDACQLCLGADIVLVDWDLHGDRGKRALSLVGALLKRSIEDVPEQLRLVVVYTGEPNLVMVLDSILERLSGLPGGVVTPFKDAFGLALHTDNSRVVVLGKPDLKSTVAMNLVADVVKECDLAKRAILEYSRLASGLLQGAVLRALGEIRHNTRRILTRFDAKLDPAYLTHRALSLPHDDASDHVLPLVMGEVQAVLEDQLPAPIFTTEVLNAWVDEKWTQPVTLPDGFPTTDSKTVIKEIVLLGPGVKTNFPTISKKVKDPIWVGECLAGSKEPGGHESFAVLASLRAHYGNATRALHLGTVLSGPNDQYFVCLLPECDCARLSANRAFLLIEIDPVNVADTDSMFNVVVEEAASFRRFRLLPKVFRSHVETFSPDPEMRMVKAVALNSKLIFHSADGQREYLWLGQLKPDHAQRVATEFAGELARVGLTESEWLRRMGQ